MGSGEPRFLPWADSESEHFLENSLPLQVNLKADGHFNELGKEFRLRKKLAKNGQKGADQGKWDLRKLEDRT